MKCTGCGKEMTYEGAMGMHWSRLYCSVECFIKGPEQEKFTLDDSIQGAQGKEVKGVYPSR